MTTALENFHKSKRFAWELIDLANLFYDELSIQFSMLGLNLNDYFRDDLDYFDFDNRCIRFSLKKEHGSFFSVFLKDNNGDYRLYFWQENQGVESEIATWAICSLTSFVLERMGLKGD